MGHALISAEVVSSSVVVCLYLGCSAQAAGSINSEAGGGGGGGEAVILPELEAGSWRWTARLSPSYAAVWSQDDRLYCLWI